MKDNLEFIEKTKRELRGPLGTLAFYGFILLILTSIYGVSSEMASSNTSPELSFSQVWGEIQGQSAAQKSAHWQLEGSQRDFQKSQRHWLPRLYLDARTYKTNDPGQVLFGNLSQREIQASDFSPDELNSSRAQTFTRGAVGLDLPLYEGGFKSSLSSMLKHKSHAEKLNQSQTQLDQYSQVALAYSSISVYQGQKQKLLRIQTDLKSLLKRYQLGQKTNPVGYSGLLGMRALESRVAGILDQMEVQRNSYKTLLQELGLTQKSWNPINQDVSEFVRQHLLKTSQEEASFRVEAQRASLDSILESTKMERAQYLPRLGGFAESYVFDGSRSSDTGYTFGLYLQWNLFDPQTFGGYGSAKAKAQAAKYYYLSLEQMEVAQKRSLAEAQGMLQKNLKRLEESAKLLEEQARVSLDLFKNGSISALQFVEILNRRTDLIIQQTEAQIEFLKTSAEKLSRQKVEVAELVHSKGGA